jgi:hypothetical protein
MGLKDFIDQALLGEYSGRTLLKILLIKLAGIRNNQYYRCLIFMNP